MFYLKANVSITGLRAEMVVALLAAERIYEKYGETLTVTSATEGKHSLTSLHYVGAALDFRLPANPDVIASALRSSLGPDFDVIHEASHIHVEFQPKYRL